LSLSLSYWNITDKPGIQLKPSAPPYDDTITDIIASAISE